MVYRARDVRGSMSNVGRRDQRRPLSSGLSAINLTRAVTAWNRLLGGRVYRTIYRLWWTILVAKVALLAALLGVIAMAYLVSAPAHAQAQAGEVAQMQLDSILNRLSGDDIRLRRSACATGLAPKLAADSVAAGIDSPNAGAWCVTVLTRAGRDGTLGYVRDPRSAQPTPAIAFDTGFVGGYLKREALPAGAPAMTALLPIADRCLDQKEPNMALCTAAGQMLGARAARGEVIRLR
jgi:hypothetical protein